MERDITECLMRLMRSLRRRPPMGRRHSHGAMRLLRILERDEGQTSRELAEMLDIRPSSLTELLNRLEEEGAIERTRDEADLRVVRVTLRGQGREMLRQFEERRRQEMEGFAQCLSQEEHRAFCEICEKLSDFLESQARSEAPKPGPWEAWEERENPREHRRGPGMGRPFGGDPIQEQDP